MKSKLNLPELIEIACNIELDGKAYYSRAAEFTANKEARKLFLELAEWEDGHYKTFKALLDGFDNDEFSQSIDPMNEAALYLEAVLGGDIFEKVSTPEELANNNPDNVDALFSFALDREKDSIIFYTSLSKIYQTTDISSKLDVIIGEEISHVRFLHVSRKRALKEAKN